MTFARIDRDSLSREAFLDQRMSGSIEGTQSARLQDVVAAFSGRQTDAPVFVFHSAFCCSTLLARALDRPGVALSLKEPDVLMGLANALRVDESLLGSKGRTDALVRAVFSLLARRFSPDECILIKPTNAANNLLPYAALTGARIVLLYGGLRDFLVSVLKKGEACKSFVRQQYNIFALDPEGLAAIPQRQAVAFTDLQAAAVVWRHQMEMFQRSLVSGPRDQVVSLDFQTLLGEPGRTLKTVARHLELGHADAELEAVATGEIFSRNSKFADQAYSADRRNHDVSLVEERYGETLDLIEQWAGQLSLGENLQLPLPRGLRP